MFRESREKVWHGSLRFGLKACADFRSGGQREQASALGFEAKANRRQSLFRFDYGWPAGETKKGVVHIIHLPLP